MENLIISNDTVSEIEHVLPSNTVDLKKLQYKHGNSSNIVWPRNYQNRYLTFTALEPAEKHNLLSIGELDAATHLSEPILEFSTNLTEGYIMKAGSDHEFGYGHPLYLRGVDVKRVRFYPTTPSWNASKYKVSGSMYSIGNYSGDVEEDVEYAKQHECSCREMFKGDSLLVDTSGLTLPQEVFCDDMCNGMFYNCTALKKTPVLPYANSSFRCFKEMFKGCSSLEEAPSLPCMNLYPSCYESMFENCSSLLTPPELPAKVLSSRCYTAMFYNSGVHTMASLKHVTRLYEECCAYMYYSCNFITQVSGGFPKISLPSFCYVGMFQDCKELTKIEGIQGIDMEVNCLREFAKGCSNLSYVQCNLSVCTIAHTGDGLLDVAPVGTISSPRSIPLNDPSGCPSGGHLV